MASRKPSTEKTPRAKPSVDEDALLEAFAHDFQAGALADVTISHAGFPLYAGGDRDRRARRTPRAMTSLVTPIDDKSRRIDDTAVADRRPRPYDRAMPMQLAGAATLMSVLVHRVCRPRE